MVALSSLWLPILLSAVIVFVASSVIHMFLGYHKSDFDALPREAEVMEALRKIGIPPGDYMMPRPGSMADMRSAEHMDKLNKGPVAVMTVMPNGMVNMGKTMATWFVYLIVVSIIAAYVASHALPPGANYLAVFRFAGATAFAAHAVGIWPETIWYKKKFSTNVKNTLDGLLYAMLTAGVFGWLWPK